MKIKNSIVGYACVLMLIFSACSKETVDAFENDTQQEIYDLKLNNSQLNNLKNQAKNRHNEYLDSLRIGLISNGYTTNTSDTIKESYLLTYSHSFFDKYYTASERVFIDSTINDISASSGLDAYLLAGLALINNDTVENYLASIEVIFDDELTPTQFTSATQTLFNNALNQNYSDATNIPIANITGVAQGTYNYWYNNIQGWLGEIIIVDPNARPKWLDYVIDFAVQDLHGAASGGAIGGMMGGVGAGPGAVMGASICSGAEALSW